MATQNYPPANSLDSMGHTSGKRIADNGYYGSASESHAWGYTSAQQVFDGLIQSGWGDTWKSDLQMNAAAAVAFNPASAYGYYWSVIVGGETTTAPFYFCWMAVVTFDLYYPATLSSSASCDAPPNSPDFTCTITILPRTYTCTSGNGGTGYYCSLDVNGNANCVRSTAGGAYVCDPKPITVTCDSTDSVLSFPDYVCSALFAPYWRCNSYIPYTAWAPTYRCELVSSTFQCYYSG